MTVPSNSEFYSSGDISANLEPEGLNPVQDSHPGGETVPVTDMAQNVHDVDVDQSPTPKGFSRLEENEISTIIENRIENDILTTSKDYREKMDVDEDVVRLLEARDNHFESTNKSGEKEVDTKIVENCANAIFGKTGKDGKGGINFSTKVGRLSKNLVEQNRDSLKYILKDMPKKDKEQEELLTSLLKDAILLTAVNGTSTDVHRLMNDLSEGKITWQHDGKIPSHTRRLIGSIAQLSNNEYKTGSSSQKIDIREEFLLGSVPGNRGLTGKEYRTYIHGSIARRVIEDANKYAKDPEVLESLENDLEKDTTYCIYSEFINDGKYSSQNNQGKREQKKADNTISKESKQEGKKNVKVDEWKPSSRSSANRSKEMYKGLRNTLDDYENSSTLNGFVEKFDEKANVNKMSGVLLTLGKIGETAKNSNTREGYKNFKEIEIKDTLDYIDSELEDRILAHTDLQRPQIKEVLVRDIVRDIENNIQLLSDDEKGSPWGTLWKTEIYIAQESLKNGDVSKSLELLGQLAIFSQNSEIAEKSRTALETMFVADLTSNNNSVVHDIVMDPSKGLEEILDTLKGLPDADLLKERAQLFFDRVKNIDDFRALYLNNNRTPEEEEKLNSFILMIQQNRSNVFNDTVDLDQNRSVFEPSSESDLQDLNFVEKIQLNAIKAALGARNDQEAREILALNNQDQILRNHGNRWMKILGQFKGRAAVLGLGVASTALAISSPALAPVAGAVGLGLLGIQAVNTGIRIAKNAKSFVQKSGGVGNAIKNLWKGVKTSAKEAWKSVKENPVEFLVGGLIPTAIRVGVNVAAPGWGRIAGAGVEVGMGMIAEARISDKKRELAEKLNAIRSLTEGFNSEEIEITDATGNNKQVSIKPGLAYRQYIDFKAKLRIGINNASINISDPDGNDLTWDDIEENEDEIFKHIQDKFPADNDESIARYKIVGDIIEKSKEIKKIEDKYLKSVAKWNSALAGAAVFGIVDRLTNFTERASEGIRDRFIPQDQPIDTPPPVEEPKETDLEEPKVEQPIDIEQPPIIETPAQEGILVQDGRVNWEDSPWHGNRGGPPQGNLPGGAANHTNFDGGTYQMAPFLLENDLQSLSVTRENLEKILGTDGINRLLMEYQSQVYNGATELDLVDILKNMGEQGQTLLSTVNN